MGDKIRNGVIMKANKIQKRTQDLIETVEKQKQEAEKQQQETLKEEIKATSPVTSSYSWMKIVYMTGGIVLAIIGLVMGYYYSTSMNMLLAVGAIIFLGGGGFMIYISRRQITKGGGITKYVGAPKMEQVNSLNLYPNLVEFDEVYQPRGMPWQCMDDHKYYYVNIWDNPKNGKDNKCQPFVLPDQQYMEPEYLAERVLELPAHQRLFRRKSNLMNALKIGILLIAMVIIWILIMTTTGDKGDETVWLVNGLNFI